LADSDDRRWIGERRQNKADRRWPGDRRSGADRRLADQGRTGDDRRNTEDRRKGERRSGRDRRDESAWKPVPLDAILGATEEESPLVSAAIAARGRAHARFSGFKVGAALLATDGAVITGCNIENATYGLTMCAERVAIYKALSEGWDAFTRVVVVADTANPTPPCGACRQLLWEYCGDVEVVLANLTEVKRRMRLSELLPLPFDARLLE
jgi:cytidine deaminase